MRPKARVEPPGGDDWSPRPPAYPDVFVWPPRPAGLARWLPGFVFPYNASFFGVAAVVWWWLTPSADTMSSLRPGWIAVVLARNAALIVGFYGVAHWWLGVRRSQGERYKFNPKWPTAARRNRTFGSQDRETVFWTLASGLPVWTAWEVVTLWLFASGRIPWLSFTDNPVWFVAWFPVLALFREVHFYAIHRLIHWPPLYRSVHSLHHRNTNPGPWSGLSMHPVEHLLYYSALAIHWVVPSHPLHAMFTGIHLTLAPIPGHAGFERVALGSTQLPTVDLEQLVVQVVRIAVGGKAIAIAGSAPSTTVPPRPICGSASVAGTGPTGSRRQATDGRHLPVPRLLTESSSAAYAPPRRPIGRRSRRDEREARHRSRGRRGRCRSAALPAIAFQQDHPRRADRRGEGGPHPAVAAAPRGHP